jgi:hypothetical protein
MNGGLWQNMKICIMCALCSGPAPPQNFVAGRESPPSGNFGFTHMAYGRVRVRHRLHRSSQLPSSVMLLVRSWAVGRAGGPLQSAHLLHYRSCAAVCHWPLVTGHWSLHAMNLLTIRKRVGSPPQGLGSWLWRRSWLKCRHAATVGSRCPLLTFSSCCL